MQNETEERLGKPPRTSSPKEFERHPTMHSVANVINSGMIKWRDSNRWALYVEGRGGMDGPGYEPNKSHAVPISGTSWGSEMK